MKRRQSVTHFRTLIAACSRQFTPRGENEIFSTSINVTREGLVTRPSGFPSSSFLFVLCLQESQVPMARPHQTDLEMETEVSETLKKRFLEFL
ncbi:hypothetical protein CEXT_550601 [Caerostris extrusa]|uniref:Uncharacterized protein n=1 Tax=Caerostris extrusa TaxID=172846 RepID=A0AAV4RGM4_CAEEX|nr:hypothetical protein CEXT_550601 [Caerostris extrusa]